MLDRLAPLAHFSRVLVEPALNGFENMLVLPTRDPSDLARGAALLDGAAREAWARKRPVANGLSDAESVKRRHPLALAELKDYVKGLTLMVTASTLGNRHEAIWLDK